VGRPGSTGQLPAILRTVVLEAASVFAVGVHAGSIRNAREASAELVAGTNRLVGTTPSRGVVEATQFEA
jgi:branched-subunit amino acid aminotransferase/4-amino-4-deoxychorismate lyase